MCIYNGLATKLNHPLYFFSTSSTINTPGYCCDSMKFFSDLGSCYRPAAAVLTPPPPPDAHAVEGGRDQVRPSTKRKNKYWQPGLSVISEDGVVLSANEREKKAAVESAKKSSPSKSASSTAKGHRRVNVSRYNDNDAYDSYYSRKKSVLLFLPAFSPTPYPF